MWLSDTVADPPQNVIDTGSFGWAALGFLIPILGLILWLVWIDKKPLTVAQCGKGALASVLIAIVAWVLMFGMMGVALSTV